MRPIRIPRRSWRDVRPVVANRGARAAASVLATALLFGCVGPDFERPLPPDVNAYTAGALPTETVAADVGAGEAQRFLADRDIPAEWWGLFHSEQLNALVKQGKRGAATL